MRIIKFGGQSLKNSIAIDGAKNILFEAQKQESVAVVVSAFDKVTDKLYEAASQVLISYGQYREHFNDLHTRHLELIEELIPPANRSSLLAEVQVLFNNLEDVLHGVHLVRECSPGSLDLILSYGEQLSACIFTYFLNMHGIKSRLVDSRGLVRTFGYPGKAIVQVSETYRRIQEELLPYHDLCVITGYIASNQEGVTTTLGRKGSDFTAALFAAALDATAVDIWTDVDGIFTANPTLVPDARVIKRMTYEEAQEMAYFGANIAHPQAIQPAAEKNIPITIRNIFNPQCPGTLIAKNSGSQEQPVRAITSIDDVALVNLEGSGMIGVPGIAGRLFTALAEREVNVIMISQASSEHSICFVVRRDEISSAVAAVNKTFELELNAGLIQRVEQLDNLVVLSVIGSKMCGTIGISGKFFNALGKNGVNVLAISQGSSERNISIIISKADKLMALKAVHSAFKLDQTNE